MIRIFPSTSGLVGAVLGLALACGTVPRADAAQSAGDRAAPCQAADAEVMQLVSQLQSNEIIQRLSAAKKLGLLGPRAQSAIPALTRALKDADVDVRFVASNALRRIQLAVPQPSTPGKVIRGELTDDDPLDALRKKSHVRKHELDLEKGSIYRIDLLSEHFDPYLRIIDVDGKILAKNDDGGAGLNARLMFTAPQDGEFQAVVTSYGAGGVGAYQLLISEYTLQDEARTIDGRLDSKDPRFKDRSMGSARYRFEAGQYYLIDLTSADFDPVLVIPDPDAEKKTLAFDDDGGEGLNARLLFTPEKTADYTLLVFSFRPVARGAFRLTIQPVRPAAAGIAGPIVPPPPTFPTEARLVVTRWAAAHGRVDSARISGLQNPANPRGQPVAGAAELIKLIAGQPDPMRVTLDLDKTGQKPRDPDAPSPLVTGAAGLSSGMTLVVCELGPGDTLKRWRWLTPRFGNGNYYATVSVPSAGISAGQELFTKQHFDAYTANSIFYEAPDFGNVVVNHNIQGGTSNLHVTVFNQKDIELNTRIGWANPLELILSEAGQKHVKNHVDLRITARLPMSFETALIIRWAAEANRITVINDSKVVTVRTGADLARFATFVVRLPAETEGPVKISAVASPGPFVNPLPSPPQSVGLHTFHSRGPTLEDTLSVRVKPGDRDKVIAKKLDEAKAKSGDVQISLYWESKDDLDLHVVEPSGERIYYGHRKSKTGGKLDVDMNVSYSRAVSGAVENIYWPKGQAPAGKYQVFVHHYSHHGGRSGTADPAPFTIRVVTRGQTQHFDGSVSYSDRNNRKVLVHEIELD